jgi:hypothetical protein
MFAFCALQIAAEIPSVSTHPAPLVLEGVGKDAVPLDGPWQFHLGDNPGWAAPSFDDSQWEQLTANKTWGAQTHPNYSGFDWYRRSIKITPAPGGSSDFVLLIPGIDDAYQLYWNGVEVGHLGSMPPHMVLYEGVPPQTFGLGPVPKAVFAIWRSALSPINSPAGNLSKCHGLSPKAPKAVAHLRRLQICSVSSRLTSVREFHNHLSDVPGTRVQEVY